MNRAPAWTDLFLPPTGTASERESRALLVLYKGTEPLLVLPRKAGLARRGLDLYPAQSRLARLARWTWRQTLRFGYAPGARNQELCLSLADSFARFLGTVASVPNTDRAASQGAAAQRSSPAVPEFALLAGNPHAPGRRFLLLVFDQAGRPAAVVKAGVESAAVHLIEQEAEFLDGTPAGMFGVPRLKGRFHEERRGALAMEFIDGTSPSPTESDRVAPLLNAWLGSEPPAPLDTFGAWQRLVKACAGDDAFSPLARRLGSASVRPAVFHGDLAPWNIKAPRGGGDWVVLDWERGEWRGLPGWDWFHFVLQPAILVRKQTAAELAATAKALLGSPSFKTYAQASGLAGRERDWLLAYLWHCRRVLRPAEGSPRIDELLAMLQAG